MLTGESLSLGCWIGLLSDIWVAVLKDLAVTGAVVVLRLARWAAANFFSGIVGDVVSTVSVVVLDGMGGDFVAAVAVVAVVTVFGRGIVFVAVFL